jgi:hypothetical protein
MNMGGARPVRLYQSALADVRYAFGQPIPFPSRNLFYSDIACLAERKRHWDRRDEVEADELMRVRRRREGPDGGSA